jgi:hypothetical protein
MDELKKILDDNATGVAISDGAEMLEDGYGYATASTDMGGSSVRAIQEMLAASAAGISVSLTANGVPRSDIVRAAVEQRSADLQGPNSIIDPTIRSMMTLSEFYALANGDLWTMACVPIELGFGSDIQLKGTDKGLNREAGKYLETMGMSDTLEELWLSRFIYGQSYPIFVREKGPGKPITSTIVANSKHIAIQPQVGMGRREVAYAPPESVIESIAGMASLPAFIHRPISWEWNEPVQQGQSGMAGFQIRAEDVMHIHSMKLVNNIYAVPPLVRAAPQIEARSDLEEMAQATVKGFRSQLWLFLVDKPRNGEMRALRSALSSEARTGMLLWGSNLKVEQHVPKSLDDLMGNETALRYTMAIYRATGATPRIVAGESPNPKGSQTDTTDVDIFLDRTQYSRRPFIHVVNYVLCSVYGERAPVASLPDMDLKIARRIKDILVPMMNFGLPSPQTAFQMAGMNPENEMAQHQADWEWRQQYIQPYTGFRQAGPDGNTTDSPSGGRPPGAEDKQPREQSVKASLISDNYDTAVSGAWSALLGEQSADNVEVFVLRMLTFSAVFREQAYADGYRLSGGRGIPDRDQIEAQTLWDEPNLRQFRFDMLQQLEGGGKLDVFGFRALLYSQMGYRMAYIAGMFQAKQEQGYTSWQRIVNAKGTADSGPCAVCVADSAVIHPMSTSFYDHPNGRCGMRWIRWYRGNIPTTPSRIPTVSIVQEIPE